MNGPYLLAIDAGTGSCRAVLFTETGAQAGACLLYTSPSPRD